MIAGSVSRVRLFLISIALIALAVVWHFTPVERWLRTVLASISGLGGWGPMIFILLYMVACICFVPGSILTIGAGTVFGLARGVVYVSIGSVGGAVASFLIGRHLARAWVTQKIAGHPRFKAIDESVAAEGWKIVLLTRLSPVFPFNLLNYAFGVTRVSLRDYSLASWIGMIPGTVLYVYIGSLAGSLANLDSGRRPRTVGEWALGLIGLGATVVVTLFITRVARNALNKKVAK